MLKPRHKKEEARYLGRAQKKSKGPFRITWIDVLFRVRRLLVLPHSHPGLGGWGRKNKEKDFLDKKC